MIPESPRSALHRVTWATRNSLKGYRAVWRDEQAFRMLFYILLALIPLAAVVAASLVQFALLIFMWLLVLIVELANSAIEAAVDRMGAESHPLAAKAKDAGSAMTMTTMLAAGFVWLMVALDNLVF